jgi:hypothetical protein
MEHGEEVSRWPDESQVNIHVPRFRRRGIDLHQHMITEPASNNRVMHHWLVGLILEIAVPPRPEVGSWPTIHFFEFFLSWPDLYTGIDAIGGEGTCSLEIPFIEDFLLDFWDTAGEVIKTFGSGFRTVDLSDLVYGYDRGQGGLTGERQVVVLEV